MPPPISGHGPPKRSYTNITNNQLGSSLCSIPRGFYFEQRGTGVACFVYICLFKLKEFSAKSELEKVREIRCDEESH